MEISGVLLPVMLSQLLLGLANGSFYTMLSLDLAVIFGLLNVINFAHGALFMLGAALTWMGFSYPGVLYWAMLVLSLLVIDLLGVVIERMLLRLICRFDHPYGLLFTLGVTLVIEGVFCAIYGVSGLPYDTPQLLQGATDLGSTMLPNYRARVVVASLVVRFVTWLMIEKTRLGVYLHADTENSRLVEAFGVSVPLMATLIYGFSVVLATFAGVPAAPVVQILPPTGQSMIITVFAVVVIGGMGPILGSTVTGLGPGVTEGLIKVFYPQASVTVVLVIMVLVLSMRPAGLSGKEKRAMRPT